jgi:multimeric flavodoxin WrbA
MPDTVLIINGATRTRGNTDIIVEKIIDGIKDGGADVELIKETLINGFECHCEARPVGPKQSRFIEDQYVVRSLRRFTPRDDAFLKINQRFLKLREKNISNCIGCYQCMKRSTCSFDDDMTDIRKYINETEVMILASPLYWCGVTGLMKVFLDRLFFSITQRTRL